MYGLYDNVILYICPAVGACRSDWRELDDDVMHNSLVTVDSREAAVKEAGDIILSGVRVQ